MTGSEKSDYERLWQAYRRGAIDARGYADDWPLEDLLTDLRRNFNLWHIARLGKVSE